jgi:hypothetical protein
MVMSGENLRRLFWISLALLFSTAAYGQSTPPPHVQLANGSDACKYAVIYKGMNLVGSQAELGIRANLSLCQDWAEKHGDSEAAHNSYVALDSLNDLQSAALKDQLYPTDGAPPVCRVFLDYQAASREAIKAGVTGNLPEKEIVDSVSRAEQNFRARFASNLGESDKAVSDLYACSAWASDSHLRVIALESRQLAHQIEEDPGSLPAGIENLAPSCKNAEAEANAILDFINHADRDRITPHDVEPYYHRATPLAHCSEQLAKTEYRGAFEHIILAVAGINNLMVLADSNGEMKLIHALPPPQPGSPIVIRVQDPYRPSSNHCTGTVLNLGSISSVDWSCNP